MSMRILFLVTLSIVILGIAPNAHTQSNDKKSKFRFFDGIWGITNGPLSGVKMQLGKGPTANINFALLDEASSLPVLEGKVIKFKKDQIKGSFGPGNLSPETTNTPFGLSIFPAGVFSFQLNSDSVSKLSGTITSSDGFEIPVEAEFLQPTFRDAKFATSLKPKIIKSYKAGKTVSYLASTILRGPSGVDNNQLALRITFHQSIEEITISSLKNLESCIVINATTSNPPYIICAIDILGPKVKVAALKFKIRVPTAASGTKLATTLDLIALDTPLNSPELALNVIAKPRTSKVKILGKKQVDVCANLIGTWAFPNGATLMYAPDLSVVLTQDGSQQTGTWLCEDHPNLPSFIISNFFADNITDYLTLSPSGAHLDWFAGNPPTIISGSKI